MVTVDRTDLLTCEDCGKEDLKGPMGLRRHGPFCPAQLDKPENASEHVAIAAEQQPAAVLSGASWRVEQAPPTPMPESVRNSQSASVNTTHAWYFAPPTVDATEMLRTTGLPDDLFHSASSWQSHQVQSQRDQGHILVTPIDAYGMKKRGSPYVHILPPEEDVWADIVMLWRPILQQEVEIERELLEQAETDLARASDAGERRNARAAIRVFSTRILQLASLDFEEVRKFFVREHQYSAASGRTDVQLLDDQIDERIARAFDEHAG